MTNMVLFQKSKGDLTLEKSIDIIHWMKEKKCIWLAKKFVGAFIRCYGEKKKEPFFQPKNYFHGCKEKWKRSTVNIMTKTLSKFCSRRQSCLTEIYEKKKKREEEKKTENKSLQLIAYLISSKNIERFTLRIKNNTRISVVPISTQYWIPSNTGGSG